MKTKVKDMVGKFTKPVILYILDEGTKSAFPLAFGSERGKGWVVPKGVADELTKCLIALMGDRANPRMRIISSAERDFAIRVQDYSMTTVNKWSLWFSISAAAKWFGIYLYWQGMKLMFRVRYFFVAKAEAVCSDAKKIEGKLEKKKAKKAKRK